MLDRVCYRSSVRDLSALTILVACIAEYWYLGGRQYSNAVLYWRNFLTFFILFALFIPISLFVTLELVRFIQGLFMRWHQLGACVPTLPSTLDGRRVTACCVVRVRRPCDAAELAAMGRISLW